MSVNRRMTKQKQLILDILRSTDTHPTADWVYENARKTLPDISLGTVYRNLSQLAADGMIQELIVDSAHIRFDARTEPHYHFVCAKCGSVYDMKMEPVENLNNRASDVSDFDIHGHNVLFYGICSHCK